MVVQTKSTDTLPRHDEGRGTPSGSDEILFDYLACRRLLQGSARHYIRLQLGHTLSELPAPVDTVADWPVGQALVIKSELRDWEPLVDPFQLGHSRLSVAWPEHLDWEFDDIVTNLSALQLCTRAKETLQEPAPSPSVSGRFRESVWIEENFEAVHEVFAGMWIAVEGQSVAAIGQTELEALEQATRVGHDCPYTYYVPTEDEPAPMATA